MNKQNELEMLENIDDVLTVKEMKELLKIGRNQAYSLLENGTIGSIRIGKSYRIPKVNIINYLKNQ